MSRSWAKYALIASGEVRDVNVLELGDQLAAHAREVQRTCCGSHAGCAGTQRPQGLGLTKKPARIVRLYSCPRGLPPAALVT
jgi:hypothetical protein